MFLCIVFLRFLRNIAYAAVPYRFLPSYIPSFAGGRTEKQTGKRPSKLPISQPTSRAAKQGRMCVIVPERMRGCGIRKPRPDRRRADGGSLPCGASASRLGGSPSPVPRPLRWLLFAVVLALVGVAPAEGQRHRRGGHPGKVLRHDAPRPDPPGTATDLTGSVLGRRDKKRLERRIRGGRPLPFSLQWPRPSSRKRRSLADLDLEVVVASGVEHGYTPREMAADLLHKGWGMADQTETHSGGMIVLVAIEDHRIEIVVGDSLAHVFGADWCHSVLYGRGVTEAFRAGRYGPGLERLLDEVKDRWGEAGAETATETHAGPHSGRRHRSRTGTAVAYLAALAGGYAGLSFWQRGFGGGGGDPRYGHGHGEGHHGHDHGHGHGHLPTGDPRHARRRGGLAHGPGRGLDMGMGMGLPLPLLSGLGGALLGAKRGARLAGVARRHRPFVTFGERDCGAQRIEGSPPSAAAAGANIKRPFRSPPLSPLRWEEQRQRLRDAAALRRDRPGGFGGGATWWTTGQYDSSVRTTRSGSPSGSVGGGGATWSVRPPGTGGNGNKEEPYPGGTGSGSAAGGGASW
ncbi:unnamed protein product [Pseudo-nitzschia multistriata]|uniref:TPM domain-containing protein n=1 Tax=Pseudo-nitzschia multistriata TaxID=183589 RepID=A0A448ZCD1_9STRA|nr:unnamed protein product [Pseudo-nitzschia multistriata]